MQRQRDNPTCADEEHEAKQDLTDPGLNVVLTFDQNDDIAAPYIVKVCVRVSRCCVSRG